MVLVQVFVHNLFVKRTCGGATKACQYLVQQGFSRMLFTSPGKRTRGKGPWSKQKSYESVNNTIAVDAGQVEFSRLFKPLAFTMAFSTTSFTCAAIWQYENIREKALSSIYKGVPWIQGKIKQAKQGELRNKMNKWWNSLSEGEKIFFPICFANVLVFLAWRIPSFHNALQRFFCSNPASKALCWPMVLSTFSHYSALHLFANMFVLHSFSTGAVMSMGKEQFLGFYFAAGVISSFASYLHKVIVNRPGLSLGASGAIMGVLAYVCTKYPELDLNIIFFPFFTFKAGIAIKAIMGLDAAGMVLGWKLFDHAAHLGGALFGMFWAYLGSQYIWNKKDPVLEVWHNIRNSTR